jgi:hypothetical protein
MSPLAPSNNQQTSGLLAASICAHRYGCEGIKMHTVFMIASSGAVIYVGARFALEWIFPKDRA